jgi:hypothetical protein
MKRDVKFVVAAPMPPHSVVAKESSDVIAIYGLASPLCEDWVPSPVYQGHRIGDSASWAAVP